MTAEPRLFPMWRNRPEEARRAARWPAKLGFGHRRLVSLVGKGRVLEDRSTASETIGQRLSDADNIDEPGGTLPEAAAASNRDKLMMLIATGARMSVGLLTFMLLARYLGPAQFGVIATAMAYAMLVGLTTDFGLNVSALRKASIERDRAGHIVGDALAVKAVLAAIALCFAAIAIALLISSERIPVFGLVFLGAVANSTADLMMVAARANRRFDIEAGLVVATSFVMLAIVGGTAALTRDYTCAAAAFALTRFGYLLAVFAGLKRWLGPVRSLRRSFSEMWSTLRESSSYALDNFLTVLSAQIDVLAFSLLLSAHDIGIYQAGARLVQVISPVAMVLSLVYLPTLSAAASTSSGAHFRKPSRTLTLEFFAFAVVTGFGFALAGPPISRILYGPAYEPLQGLWAGFGVFALLRLIASSFGIQLTAMGHIPTRIRSSLLSIALFGIATLIILPWFGLAASSTLLAFSALPSFLWLGASLVRTKKASPMVGMALMGGPVIAVVIFMTLGLR